jgi:hypothetical protein
MKTCRTLKGLLAAMSKGESCCLKYTNKSYNLSDEKHIIYLQSGTNLIVGNETYKQIENHLIQVK